MEYTEITAKRIFRRTGMALLAMAVIQTLLQIVLAALPNVLNAGSESFWRSGVYSWLIAFLPLYAAAIPAAVGILKKLPSDRGEPGRLGGKDFFLFLLMCFPLMYGGSILGTVLSSLLSGGTATNAVIGIAFDDSPWKIIVLVFLAPLMEEFLFRRQLIDRTAKYGEKPAILFSALCFGLYHMNLYQFFYAFGIGLVFGYVYTRTRRLRYSVIMHMIINTLGSVVVPLLLSKIDLETVSQIAAGELDEAAMMAFLPDMVGFALYILALIGLSIAGLIVLIVKARKLGFLPSAEELPKGERFRTICGNPGMILFTLFCLVFFVLSLMG